MFRSLRALFPLALVLAASLAHASGTPDAEEEAALAALQDAYLLKVTPGERAETHRQLLDTVLRRVKRSYALDVDLRQLAATASTTLASMPAGTGEPAEVFKRTVNSALGTLDAQSRYIEPRAAAVTSSEESGSFVGLGIELEPQAGAIRVVAPMPGSPAERAGVMAGDVIVRVDDQPMKDVSLSDAIARMRGQAGTRVALTLQRAGSDREIQVSVTRDVIRRQVLRWSMQDDVLVLRLTGFTGNASSSVAQAVTEATAKASPRGVVLDLRGNPGGLLREAVRIADAFLAKGEIVSLRNSNSGRVLAYSADPEEMLPGVPMAILVDRRSASASELVADALQQNGRALVLGQRSFGKGSVQATLRLGDNVGSLKLTTAIYHGPNGLTLHRVGVVPDIELLTTAKDTAGHGDTSATAAADVRAEAADPRATVRTSRARVAADRCADPAKSPDPALACALSYVRVGSLDAFLRTVAD